jgi:hypothetical protein
VEWTRRNACPTPFDWKYKVLIGFYFGLKFQPD